VPIFTGEKAKVRDEVLCEFYSPEQPGEPLRHTQRALRTERWKLTWYPLIRRYQLFDMLNDALELVDLLVPWRGRYRLAVESGRKNIWRKDVWAARDPRPTYTQNEIQTVANEMYDRMIAQMKEHGDPLLSQDCPPRPMV
jgi:hypothetical protein